MNSRWELIFAGVGGQGLLLDGTLLATAAIDEGNYAVMAAAYGSESRGTFTRADLIISSEEIDFPEALEPNAVVALAQVAYDRYTPSLCRDALLLYNSDQVVPCETAARQIGIPMVEMARQAGNVNAVNMVALGFLLGHINAASPDSVIAAIERQFHGKDAVITCNVNAFRLGLEYCAGR